MTFSFRLTADLALPDRTSYRRDASAPSVKRLDVLLPSFPDADVKVTVPQGSEAVLLSATGRRFRTQNEAETAGQQTATVLRYACVGAGVPAFFTDTKRVRSFVGDGLRAIASEHGVDLRGSVHGLDVYEETSREVMIFSSSAALTVERPFPLAEFERCIAQACASALTMDRTTALAADLFASSAQETSEVASFLSLIIALEVMATRQDQPAFVQRLVTALVDSLPDSEQEEDEEQLESIRRRLSDLRVQSISGAVRDLVGSVAAELGHTQRALRREATSWYRVRSLLVHEGHASDANLRQLATDVRPVVQQLLLKRMVR